MLNSILKIRLFWKILLWFWLILALVFSLNIFVTQVNNENERFRAIPPHLFEQLDNVRLKLKFFLENNPRRKNVRRRFLRNAYLLDVNGQDYFGKKTPKLLNLLNDRVNQENQPYTVFKKRFLYFGGVEFIKGKKTYRLFLSQRFSFLSKDYLGFFLREFAQNLLISTLLISFPLSFFLAWVFTRPIKRLQQATQELAINLKNTDNLNKLTRRKDEFGDLARDFDKMASHLEHIINSKNQLLADVSHELRTPLARLQIAIGLASKKSNQQFDEELDRIKLEADRMNQMISSLLDYSKANSGTFELNTETFNLSKLLEMIIKDIKFEAEQQSIEIRSKLQPDIFLLGDQTSMLSCIENILRNALRYADSTVELICSLESNENSIHISIVDDGVGVDSNQLEKLFDAFYRPQTDRARISGGAGLGLSIAKKAVESFNGQITAKNIAPNGLGILIKIPFSTVKLPN